MKTKHFTDIDELLKVSKAMIDEINPGEQVSKVKVKNILENFRSALDYSAQHINTLLVKNRSKKGKNVYFPYGLDKEKFKNSLIQNLSTLQNELPVIFELVDSLQFHKTGDKWLYNLCSVTNKTKHNQLLDMEQNTIETKSVTSINAPFLFVGDARTIGKISFSGNIINGKKFDDLEVENGNLISHTKNEVSVDIEFEITENHFIKINDLEEDLITFLNHCYNNIKKYVQQLENI